MCIQKQKKGVVGDATTAFVNFVYGVSGNQRSWYDNSNAVRLGYRPQDDSEPYTAEILAAEAGQAKHPIAERYQGGTFCADEYDAETPPD